MVIEKQKALSKERALRVVPLGLEPRTL